MTIYIHQPVIKEYWNDEGSVLYMNSGDWVEHLTSLEMNQGEWSLYKYDESEFDDIESINDEKLAECRFAAF